MPDYYADLNVNKDASAKEIKKAFRKLAQKHHPDRGGKEADFKKINEAYETLGDTNKKAQYDAMGSRNYTGQPGFTHRGQQSPFEGGFNPHDPDSFNDFVHTVFGRGFGQYQQRTVNHNITVQYEISLEDAYTGLEKQLDINLPSGAVRSIHVKIPPGVNDGSKLRFAGLGDNSQSTVPPGDLIVVVRVLNSSKWHRQHDDLITTIKVSALDAILGCEVQFKHIDKKVVSVKIPAGTQPNAKIRLKGKGLTSTRTGQHGNLILLVEVIIPSKLNNEQIELYKSIRDMR
jgi:DnaJ-class molecular chaperone|tara:strand:- start:2904 stop:3767 length:864 start_codon:yes stop_codon:yes gene_type:complete